MDYPRYISFGFNAFTPDETEHVKVKRSFWSLFALVLNSSLNMGVYLLSSSNFRDEFVQFCNGFLDATSHLYNKGLCPSIGSSVGSSVVVDRGAKVTWKCYIDEHKEEGEEEEEKESL